MINLHTNSHTKDSKLSTYYLPSVRVLPTQAAIAQFNFLPLIPDIVAKSPSAEPEPIRAISGLDTPKLFHWAPAADAMGIGLENSDCRFENVRQIRVPLHKLGKQPVKGICLANLKQLNHKDRKDRKEKSLRGLCGLGSSNPSSNALTGVRFTNG
jgi:hypothetical protein